jgi:putative ABC transport system substrate-binding protein
VKRREFITVLGGAAVAWPLVASAQQAGKVYRVGLIFPNAPVSDMAGSDPVNHIARAFVHGLRALGYVEGQNLVLERRSAEGKPERYREIVAELVQRKVEVIVTAGDEMTHEAKHATNTVPIVMGGSYDPVGAGIVASLAQPGGNITGFVLHAGYELDAHRLQMLKEALPEATRIAFLGVRSFWDGAEGEHVRAAARVLGVALVLAEHTPTRYADAFSLMTRDRPHAIFVSRHGAQLVNRKLIADFALEHRLPGMFPYRENVEAGGLMSYGSNLPDSFGRAAGYVDKILKGAKPADLPIQQPTKFELVINLKTAKAFGLAIPQTLLARADEVIE